jgi:ABC-2 type transport system permease protein
LTSSVAAVWGHRSVLRILVQRDLAVKYQQSVLGYFWSLIEPLSLAVIYWFIFGFLYGGQITDDTGLAISYPLFIISTIFGWAWFNSAIGESTAALTNQSRLVTTINMPREIFPIGRVVGRFAEFVAGMPILIGAAFIFDAQVTWRTFVAIPLAVTLQFALLVGLSLILSAANVMLQDIERFMRLVLRVLFYAAPIIYPLSKVNESDMPEWVKTLYMANPLVGIMELYHAAWFKNDWPSNELLIGTTVGCLVVLGIGMLVFRKMERAFLKEL